MYSILFSVKTMNGQNFVTEPKDFILKHLDSNRIAYRVDKTPDGFEFIHFSDGKITVEYYIGKEGFCAVYLMQFPEEGLAESLNALNSAFTKIKEGVWREFDGDLYFIWSLEKTDNGYSLSVFKEPSLKNR